MLKLLAALGLFFFSLTGQAELKACGLLFSQDSLSSQISELANFTSKSSFVAKSDFQISDEDVEVILKTIEQIPYPHNPQIGYEVRDQSLLTTPWKLEAPKGFNTLSPEQIAESIPASVSTTISSFLQKLATTYLAAKGTPNRKIALASFMLRTTSNSIGHRIDKDSYGNPNTGLHTHKNKNSNTIEFVWAIRGLGAKGLLKKVIVETQEGEVFYFGGEVLHGSPDSEDLRVIGVGRITFEP